MLPQNYAFILKPARKKGEKFQKLWWGLHGIRSFIKEMSKKVSKNIISKRVCHGFMTHPL